jgi:hypothetical protein
MKGNKMAKQITAVTASSMTKWLTCQRAYHYRYNLGIRSTKSSDALRFGTAWHKAMEERAHGKGLDDSFHAAIVGTSADDVNYGMLYGMLKAYWTVYGERDQWAIAPEVEFMHKITGCNSFRAAGKLDGIGDDGVNPIIVEHKTTSEAIDPGSDYWMRLRFNVQMLQYVTAYYTEHKTIPVVVYDVIKKTGLRPSKVPVLDANGLKTVLNADGQRVFLDNGKPRQAAADGMTLLTRPENAEEFAVRVYDDIMSRPDFYFQRKNLTVLQDDILLFKEQRVAICKQLDAAKKMEKKLGHHAYTRNCSATTCKFCDFSMFCMTNITPDVSSLPEGYEVKRAHEELEITTQE